MLNLNHVLFKALYAALFCCGISVATATEALKEDNHHIRTWNKFAKDSLTLHEKLTATDDVVVKSKTGGYARLKDFYQEHAYYRDEKLISRVQWEKENPEQLHSIEVFVRDEQGRVIRDYSASYLPFYHNAPTQTLISFHHHSGNLHAFRTFDASGALIVERCMGTDAQGKEIQILLDEDEIYEASRESDGIMQSAEYLNCFAGLQQQQLGKYILPQ